MQCWDHALGEFTPLDKGEEDRLRGLSGWGMRGLDRLHDYPGQYPCTVAQRHFDVVDNI